MQRWSSDGYAKHGAFVPLLGKGVVELLAPQSGERILDLGCGDGTLTAQLVTAGAIVTGFDASAELASAARARGIEVRVGDAHALPFESEFDAVFSNAALHWMREPEKVLTGVARALVPGGRFVGEMGGFGNVAAIRTAIAAVLARAEIAAPAREPMYYPTVAEYEARLRDAGFTVDSIALFGRQTPLATGMRAWLETFAGVYFGAADATRLESLRAEVEALLAPVLRDPTGAWSGDYVRLRFAAHKPA